jgi:hypothetical protein
MRIWHQEQTARLTNVQLKDKSPPAVVKPTYLKYGQLKQKLNNGKMMNIIEMLFNKTKCIEK